MEDTSNRYTAKGRRSGKAPVPKPIKHTVKINDNGVQFDVFAYRKLTEPEVAAAIKDWLGNRKMSELAPWRTYRIQLEEDES
ncbi:MAG: hypothetical protein K8S99_16130 [Planctomycetes bacterium]|nr:hypothetical protein [Planctomycetota bacterium]